MLSFLTQFSGHDFHEWPFFFSYRGRCFASTKLIFPYEISIFFLFVRRWNMSIFIGSSLSMALYALECNNTLETCRGNSGNFLIKMPPDIGWCRNGKIEMWTKVSFVFLYVCMFIFFCILNGNLIHEKNLLEWSQFGLEISFRIMKLFNIRDISLIELYWIFSIK